MTDAAFRLNGRIAIVTGAVSRPPRQLTHSDLEIPSGFGRYAARLTSMPRLSARFSAGVIQSSASCGRTSL